MPGPLHKIPPHNALCRCQLNDGKIGIFMMDISDKQCPLWREVSVKPTEKGVEIQMAKDFPIITTRSLSINKVKSWERLQ